MAGKYDKENRVALTVLRRKTIKSSFPVATAKQANLMNVVKTSLARKREEREVKYFLMRWFIEGFTSSLVVNIQLSSNVRVCK